jgi:hypothetical protein
MLGSGRRTGGGTTVGDTGDGVPDPGGEEAPVEGEGEGETADGSPPPGDGSVADGEGDGGPSDVAGTDADGVADGDGHRALSSDRDMGSSPSCAGAGGGSEDSKGGADGN